MSKRIMSTSVASVPVTILMGVCNGASHLEAQLNSISAQAHQNWKLHCSDDGSTDGTVALIAQFAKRSPGRVTFQPGPQTGFCDNYMQMIRALSPHPGYVSFADQDDIWMADKLSRGVQALQKVGDTPTLYFSRRWYWYPDRNRRIASALVRRKCNFQNALIENVAGGNTIVLNPAAARLARRAARITASVFAHDWWLYLLISGVGGQVIFDPGTPTLLYRQHGANAIGAGHGALAHLKRKARVLRGDFAHRVACNVSAMQAIAPLLTAHNRLILSHFAQARQAPLLPRLQKFGQSGAYRQSWQGTLGFWGAASLGQV